jgi:hypothetical protein
MSIPLPPEFCDCCGGTSRREFIKTTAAGLAVAATGILPAMAAPDAKMARVKSKASQPETLVATFYKSLTESQRQAVVFPFDHPLRSKVDNNWFITDKKVSKFYNKDQQQMIREIFTGIHSPEYVETVLKQIEHDNVEDGGFGSCAVALFGEPGQGKFEFVFTGRHVTRRCDGDSVEGAAFGGPIFYGHAAESFNEKPTHPGNVYWYQAKRANEVFQMLDGKQRELALLEEPRKEKATETVKLTGKKTGLPGIPMSSLTRDQQEHVRKVMSDVLAPFRKRDADEALKLVEANGFDNVHMSFYKNYDIGKDGVWDVWQLEGPAMLWYFRGAPHVHTWVHIRDKA